ncbi:hypothetical protein CAPTEDRAFT_197201 [Capitella teleta]|uniref:THAP9-like helix-turn-helix domain-containing protein n=1 Tax=Capitella teleta TaxID=283909 RepID=R7UCZ5_CAPTE|nr:hypothetical protein CAPTEDRAFT_197201 [Capitella teleta]|eukprot:ELU03946.1 hypothetical protein CAPTEDRAFT_197201 [Capitella teleta]
MVRSKVRILSEELKGLKKELKNTAAREQSAKERLSDSLQKLKEQNFINAELHLKLEVYEDIPVELFSRPTSGYSEQQKDFAILHLYSPKAYEFIKGYLCLPSSRTIRSCCFMLDAMSIRQEWSYDRCWNNNPFVNHFKAAFRALISRCGAAAVYGSIGNCVAQENVELVRASLQSPSYASPFHEEDVALDVIEDNLSEHFSSELYAILAQNIVTYICGWVVKKILKFTKATAPEPGWSMDHRFRFLYLKNRGGLVCPSAGQPSSSEGAAPCVEQTWQFECV